VQVGGRDRPQRRQFGRGIVIIEDVEGPYPHGPASQVRMVGIEPVECLQGNGWEAR
jgi:hypothetical protein